MEQEIHQERYKSRVLCQNPCVVHLLTGNQRYPDKTTRNYLTLSQQLIILISLMFSGLSTLNGARMHQECHKSRVLGQNRCVLIHLLTGIQRYSHRITRNYSSLSQWLIPSIPLMFSEPSIQNGARNTARTLQIKGFMSKPMCCFPFTNWNLVILT